MNYPLISDYVSSILSAEDNFKKLTHLRPILDEEGQPIMSSGNFAVVFKMKDEQTGKLYAVKCFLKEQEGRAESYKLIEEELEFVSSNYLTPIRYMEDELFVDSNNTKDTEFPILLMDWIEGITLDKYIRTHLGYAYGLAMLTYRFSKLASWLLAQPFAHGDLKCDNIIVKKEDGSLVLVDYDGMYVPAMKGQKAREMGSPDFRHPKRTENNFDEHIDDFAITNILLSLKAISLNQKLLKLYGASDRLLFSQKDYLDLSNSYVINAIRPLMVDDEFNLLLSFFLLAHSQMKLSIDSFKLLTIKRPHENIHQLKLKHTELDASDSEVQLEIGRRFFYGFGIPKNTIEAFKWFTLSAEQGNSTSQKNLGHCYREGKGTELNYLEAINWYFKAAKQGNIEAKYYLGYHYCQGKGVEQDYCAAVNYFLEAAGQENSSAQFALGLAYELGRGVIQNFSEAAKWYLKAAKQGNAKSQNKLGFLYYNGKGLKQDYTKGIMWYLKAAEQGHAEAQNNLGNIYYKGEGLVKNYYEAVKWYLRSAEQNCAVAQNNLGNCYYKGEGVQQNFHEAINWYSKAAEQGNVSAQFNIATCYYLGQGVLQDYKETVKWLVKAAKQGHVLAMYNLGICYEFGKGVTSNISIAKEWYEKAAKMGNKNAIKQLSNLDK